MVFTRVRVSLPVAGRRSPHTDRHPDQGQAKNPLSHDHLLFLGPRYRPVYAPPQRAPQAGNIDPLPIRGSPTRRDRLAVRKGAMCRRCAARKGIYRANIRIAHRVLRLARRRTVTDGAKSTPLALEPQDGMTAAPGPQGAAALNHDCLAHGESLNRRMK